MRVNKTFSKKDEAMESQFTSRVIGVDHKRLGAKEMESELVEIILHFKRLFVMNGVVLFSSFQLSRLKRNDAFPFINICL